MALWVDEDFLLGRRGRWKNIEKEKEKWGGHAPPQFQPFLAAAAITNFSTTTTLLPLLILRGRRVGVSKNETMSQSEHSVHCHTILLLALLFLHTMENHPTTTVTTSPSINLLPIVPLLLVLVLSLLTPGSKIRRRFPPLIVWGQART